MTCLITTGTTPVTEIQDLSPPQIQSCGPLKTPQCDWEDQAALLRSLPDTVNAPAIGALAASCAPMSFFDHGDFVWVKDRDLTFSTLSAHRTDDVSRFVLRYEMHRTNFLGRVPTIGNQPPLNSANIAVRPDFGTAEDAVRVQRGHSGAARRGDISQILDARQHPLRAKIALGLMETLITAGFVTEPTWLPRYTFFSRHRGVDKQKGVRFYDFGDRTPQPRVALPPVTAMPMPYLAFEAQDVAAACAQVFVTDEKRSLWPVAVLDGFLAAYGEGLAMKAPASGAFVGRKVRSGSPVAELIFQGKESRFSIEIPTDVKPALREGSQVVEGYEVAMLSSRLRPGYWLQRSPRERLDSAEGHFGDTLPLMLLLWLKNQAVLFEDKPGLVYFPSTLLATSAALSKPEELVWRMEEIGAQPTCFDTESAFFRYPALPFQNRRDMLTTLPSETQVDFRPYDPAYAAHLRAPEQVLVAVND